MSKTLRKTLKQDWLALGAKPKRRALIMARIAANRDDPALTTWMVDLIECGTPPCAEKRQALALLNVPSNEIV